MMRGWERSRKMIILFALLGMYLFFSGCDRYARYRALNFFFDGVPHPDDTLKKKTEPVTAGSAGQAQKPANALLPTQFSHPSENVKESCSFCHESITNMVIPPRDICLKCHSHIKDTRPFLHGPAAIDCLVCHDVHKSEVKTLLRKIGNFLCFDCHYIGAEKKMLEKTEAHRELTDDEIVCLQCHDPHGGSDRFFLREKQEETMDDGQDSRDDEAGAGINGDVSQDKMMQDSDNSSQDAQDKMMRGSDNSSQDAVDDILQEQDIQEDIIQENTDS